jgi:hypothetical protein
MHRKSLEAAELLQKSESIIESTIKNASNKFNENTDNCKSNITKLDSFNSVATLRAKAKQHLNKVQNDKNSCK